MRISKDSKLGSTGIVVSVLLAMASLVSGPNATATDLGENVAGTQKLYGAIPPDQAEHLSTGDRIKAVAAQGSMTAIWETLEHGEKVECLDCIPSIAQLLIDPNPRTREIAAWWLRRRVVGVFGPGEVYVQTLGALASNADPVRRAYAANALGEFLVPPGIDACANAVVRDGDPNVRAAAAAALGRLNDDGSGALAKALVDVDSRVRLAALKSAGRLNAFKDTATVIGLAGDAEPLVRRNAADLLGGLRAAGAVDALIGLAKDPEASVRNSAAHALGALHDPKAQPVLADLAANDPDRFVRDQATIALRRL